MKRVRALAVLSVSVAVIALGGQAFADPAGPSTAGTATATSTITTFAHNVNGLRTTEIPDESGRRGMNSAVDYTIGRIKGHGDGGSDIVALTEICLHQAAHVASKLPGYRAVFAPKRANEDRCNDSSPEGVDVSLRGYYGLHENDTPSDDDYGSAVFVRGPLGRAFSPDLFDHGGADEDFKAACAETTVKNVAVTACSLKLPSGDGGYQARVKSTNKLADSFEGRARDRLFVLGGDFNAEPHESEMTPLYRTRPGGNGYFVEGDQSDEGYYDGRCAPSAGGCRSGESTHPTPPDANNPNKPRKYDYLFFSDVAGARYDVERLNGNAQCDGPCNYTANIPAGDHAIVTASVGVVF
ncbi:MAG: endonuclease/exonuclease/phosphatase family protein [Thermocrispum sp.]